MPQPRDILKFPILRIWYPPRCCVIHVSVMEIGQGKRKAKAKYDDCRVSHTHKHKHSQEKASQRNDGTMMAKSRIKKNNHTMQIYTSSHCCNIYSGNMYTILTHS